MLHQVQYLVGIVLRPEIDIQCMQPQKIGLLVARVATGQSPFVQTSSIWRGREILGNGIRSVDGHGAESGKASGMAQMDTIQR